VAEATCYGYVGRGLPTAASLAAAKRPSSSGVNGAAELHEGTADGMVLAARHPRSRAHHQARRAGGAACVGLAGEQAWKPCRTGPCAEIVANHRSVTRFDKPDDEPLAKEVWADLQSMWKTIDP